MKPGNRNSKVMNLCNYIQMKIEPYKPVLITYSFSDGRELTVRFFSEEVC